MEALLADRGFFFLKSTVQKLDSAEHLKGNSELHLIRLFIVQIQRALVRNNQTQRFSQKQAQRLHQGLVTSTTEQVALPLRLPPPPPRCPRLLRRRRAGRSLLCSPRDILSVSKVMERLCVRVQQQVCVLRGVGEVEELQAAKQVLKEARNSRAVSGRETRKCSSH